MTSTNNSYRRDFDTRSSRIRRRRTMTPSSAFVFWSMACAQTAAFAPSTPTVPDIAVTQRNFRHVDESENDDSPLSSADLDVMNFLSNASASASSPLSPWQGNDIMPSWLSPNISSSEDKLSILLNTMIDTYLSPSDAYKVINAIREAALGDRNKVQGAADFCLILVETMEMGMPALIAAAIHYCACYNVRQEVALRPSLDFVSAAENLMAFW